jgi:hypothetical protein
MHLRYLMTKAKSKPKAGATECQRSASTSEAVSSLASVMERGSPEEKEAAQKTIETIRNIGKEQIVGQRKIESTLRSSIAAQDAAAGAFLRGNQLSESSLNMLGNLDNAYKEGTAIQKTQLERLSEQKQALDLMSKIGGGNDPLLNALQEKNKALTEFKLI